MILIIILVIVIIIFAYCIHSQNSEQETLSKIEYYDSAESNIKPKVNAEIDKIFYDEIKNYCQSNSLTISDLIRKSIRFYIDNK